MNWLLLLFTTAVTTAVLHIDTVQAESWVFVSLLQEKQIITFRRIPESGLLSRHAVTPCPAEPAGLTASTSGEFLYASMRSTRQLASFQIEARSGRLRLINLVHGGQDPAYLQIDNSGQFLLTAYYVDNKVTVHRIGQDGSLSNRPVQTLSTAEKAHGIAIDSANNRVFVTHTGADCIFQFRFEQATGHLESMQPPFVKTTTGHNPRHIALHPSDRWAYVGNEAASSISFLELTNSDGIQAHKQTLSTLSADVGEIRNSTARCQITPDGQFVYVANRGHNSIAGFAINQKSGELSELGQTPTEQIPRSFTISPDGRHLYAAGQGSGQLAAYEIHRNGTLDRIGTYTSGPISWWVLAVNSTPLDQ